MWDPRTLGLISGVLVLLGTATVIGHALKTRGDESRLNTALIEMFRRRVRAWWVLCSVLAAAFVLGQAVTVLLFGLISFWALREFITLTPTRPGDHRALFWVFFLLTPLQFLVVELANYRPAAEGGQLSTLQSVLVGLGSFEFFSIMIPVYGFLFVLVRVAIAGDYKRFLERTAKIQAGLLICVYCLSHAPALLTLRIPERLGEGEISEPLRDGWGAHVRLLFFFILIVQLSDALQYAWARIASKHPIVPTINPNKTWEGLIGGALSVTLIGSVLWWATPFQGSEWWMAGAMSLVISLMSFAGSITLSAIKRDRGVKDYGTLVEGHGGVLDRIDSLCFAAPVFYHLTRWWLGGA
jgi:phosphatidate cytidylyltransferase